MLEQAGGFRGNLPTTWRKIAPRFYMASNFVDYGGDVVLLLLGGKALAFVKDHLLLRSRDFALLRFGNRRDEFRPASTLDDSLRGLTVCIEFPVLRRALIRRIQDGMIEEQVRHLKSLLGNSWVRLIRSVSQLCQSPICSVGDAPWENCRWIGS